MFRSLHAVLAVMCTVCTTVTPVSARAAEYLNPRFLSPDSGRKPSIAQTYAFQRQVSTLKRDFQSLDYDRQTHNNHIGSYETERKRLLAEAKRIEQLPPGILRDAQTTGLKRDVENLQRRSDSIGLDSRRLRDRENDLTGQARELSRRLRAAGH